MPDLAFFVYPYSINKDERDFSLEEKRKLDAFIKVYLSIRELFVLA